MRKQILELGEIGLTSVGLNRSLERQRRDSLVTIEHTSPCSFNGDNLAGIPFRVSFQIPNSAPRPVS